MHAGAVKHLLAFRYTQKACALLKCLRPQLRHLFDLRARGERTVFFAVGDDILCRCRVKPRNPLQKGSGGRVQIDADGVNAGLDHAAECGVEFLFRHIMLILSDTDRLRIDFHQFRQRILQPARDGYRRAQVHIILREFLRRQLRRGIDGRARLVDDHIGNAAAKLMDHLDGHGLRLTRGRAVADGKMAHIVLFDEL